MRLGQKLTSAQRKVALKNLRKANRVHWNKSIEERFWEKVKRRGPDDCWPWIGSRNDSGYGQIWWKKSHGRPIIASRLSWILMHGNIKSSQHVLHTCDNPACVNPKHLYVGTPARNVQDKIERDRQPHGVNHYAAKINPRIVRKIRRLWKTGNYYQREIAEMVGTELWNVKSVLQGKAWVRVK